MKSTVATNAVGFWPGFVDVALIFVALLIFILFLQMLDDDAFCLQEIRDKQLTNEEAIREAIVDFIPEHLDAVDFNSELSVQKITFSDRVLFPAGKADLNENGLVVLDTIGSVMVNHSELYEEIQIAGHTDSDPISNAQFDSNWELSSARATAVVKHLTLSAGLDPSAVDISSVGYAEYRPLDATVPEDDEQKVIIFAKNRRIEMSILYQCEG